MKWIRTARHVADEALLTVARGSQAAVIGALDRVLAGPRAKPGTLSERVRKVQFGLADVVVGDSARAVDESYGLAQRLLDLHREFAQRLFDVADPRERPGETDSAAEPAESAHILPFPAARSMRKH